MSKPRSVNRRKVLCNAANALAGGLIGVPLLANAANRTGKPERLPPQVGDLLAYPSWEHGGELIGADRIEVGAAPAIAYPHDPELGITRERSRLNQILLVRLDPASLSPDTAAHAVDGLLAYSGVCTHTACGVTEWNPDLLHFVCPCHASEFDPKNKATVVNGPARRALPLLPIRVEENRVVVADGFSGRIGAKKKK